MPDESPYTKHPSRLADVIAAIQVMGTYSFASRHIDKWEAAFGVSPSSSSNWLSLFKEHPEFFQTTDEDWVSLVWRRSSTRSYAPGLRRHLTPQELDDLQHMPYEEQLNLTNEPLSPNQITSLIEAAIKLHSAAISHKQEKRWWIPVLTAFIGILIGAALRG